MAGRIFLANVGVNASHGFTSPVFADGTFEFIPIPEDRQVSGNHIVRYKDLRSSNDPGHGLLQYIPRRLWDLPTHNDPEFDTFTYGDNCGASPRAAGLRALRPDDFLFFLCRLEQWLEGRPSGEYGFYLVAFLQIREVLRDVTSHPNDGVLARFGANAHMRRGLSDPKLWDGFWVFRGSERSQRFRRAVPVTRVLATRVFTRADGSAWRWDSRRSDLQIIGSYTRSCRCIIDTTLPDHRWRAEALWEWVASHAPIQPNVPGL